MSGRAARLSWLAALVLVPAAGLVWLGVELAKPCRALDTMLGRSGCLASHRIADLTALGSTLAVMPGDPSLVAVGGLVELPGIGDRTRHEPRIVFYDLVAGTERARLEPALNGTPDQLAISPDGEHIAWSCSPLYQCGSSTGDASLTSATFVSVVALEGETLWSEPVRAAEAFPDAEGRAFALGFSEDGEAVIAGPAIFALLEGERIAAGPGEPAAPGGVAHVETVEIAGNEVSLALPAGFVPFPRMQAALSPDGTRIAALSRRFSGSGSPRALLQVWDAQSAAILARHEIGEDLYRALAWLPDGSGLVVAAARGGGVDLRIYGSGGGVQ